MAFRYNQNDISLLTLILVILAFIAFSGNKGSCESVHMHRLSRAFAAYKPSTGVY